MTVISTGSYTDQAALVRSVRALCEGLEARHIIVALPQQNSEEAPSIEVRVASLWEKFLSFIRFKPIAIRLPTIQPLLSQFFKNNDQLLSSSPDLYPMLLKIYLHSICQREKILPACLQEKRSDIRPASEPSANDEFVITFNIITGEETRIVSVPPEDSDAEMPPFNPKDFSEAALEAFIQYQKEGEVKGDLSEAQRTELAKLNETCMIENTPTFTQIPVPYKLVKNLPCNIAPSENSNTMPSIELHDFSETAFLAFRKYQSEGQLEENLSEEKLIELASLADSFGHKELIKRVVVALIHLLNESNCSSLFPSIVELIINFDVQDQEVVLCLIAKGKRLTNFCLNGKELENAFPEKWLMKYILAQCYEYGIGMEKNFEQAIQLYQNLSNENNPWGQVELGRCYHYVSSRHKEAFQLYTLAANQGLASACYHRAVCFTHKIGVERDTLQALNLFRQLAQDGNKLGLYGLGNFYKNGTRVPLDIRKAIKLYELAGNEPRALYELGRLYEEGIGVPKNPEEAFKRYQAAAQQGLLEAEYHLGKHYEKNKDIARAKYWYTKAKNQGHRNATRAFNRLVIQ